MGRVRAGHSRIGEGLLVLVALLSAATTAVAAAETHFDTDLEGWRVTGDNAAAWNASGNPGGCLYVNDLASGDMNHLVAPPAYLGAWSGMSGADTLSCEYYFQNTSGGALIPTDYVFRIAGPGGAAHALAGTVPPQSTWSRVGVSLAQSDWVLESGSWSGLLAEVNTLTIEGEYVNGDEIVRVDNVRVSGHVGAVFSDCVGETFSEEGLGDWSFSNTSSTSNPGSGGNGGGFCQIGDGTGISYAFAPARFLGNWFPLIGHASLTIDLRRLSSSGEALVVSEFIRLSGPGGTAVVGMPAEDLPPVGRVWRSYDFPLEAARWTVTAGSWDALLANVTECRLQLEFAASSETIGFDNFGRLAPGCAPLDLPVLVHAGDVELCDHFGFTGISTVALNPADGLLYGLVDLASGSGGGLWALEGAAAGTRLAAYAQPTGLLFDSAGNAFISEDYGGEVFRYAPGSGSSLWISGFHSGDDDPSGFCFAPAGFDGPNVDPGDILVTDCGSGGADEVWAFSAAVAENERLVMPHSGDRDFRDITAAGTGEVYLAGTIDPTTVSLLAPDGTRTTLALSAPIAGMIGIAYDTVMDALYVIAMGDSSLRRIDPATGTVELVADGFAGFNNCGIDIDSAGRRLWVADYGAGRVYEFCLASGSAADDFGPAAGDGLLAGLSAWPNPAAAGVGLRFALRAEAETRLEVYDLAGRLVRCLVADRLPAGERSLHWDGRDAEGRRVASGLYLVRLSAGEEARSARVVILR